MLSLAIFGGAVMLVVLGGLVAFFGIRAVIDDRGDGPEPAPVDRERIVALEDDPAFEVLPEGAELVDAQSSDVCLGSDGPSVWVRVETSTSPEQNAFFYWAQLERQGWQLPEAPAPLDKGGSVTVLGFMKSFGDWDAVVSVWVFEDGTVDLFAWPTETECQLFVWD